MKNRKSTLVLALVMLAALLLGGCGGEKSPDNQTAETKAPAEADKPLSLGVIEGTTYTNKYAGLEIRLDDSWSIYPADQLQELPDIVKEMTEGTELEKSLENVQQITDVLAENPDNLTTINVLLQKLSTQQRIAYKLLSEEDVLDSILDQQDTLVTAYAQGGINVSTMEKITVTCMGEEHFALKTVAETQGVPYYILQIYDYHLGEYSVTITMGSFVEDNTESMLQLLYKLD